MKHFLSLNLVLLSLCATAQHKLEKIWETDSVVAIPESVLPDTKKGILYIALINGAPWEVDGKGGIGKLSPDGTRFDSAWITGLDAPKGMGLYGNRLYVADVTNVVVIDVQKGRIEKKIRLDSAKALNDITVTENGIVYVSDSRAGTVWRIEKDVPTLYLENLSGINGLKAIKGALLIASGKAFVKANAAKKITPIAQLPEGGDGIEPVGNGDYLVTSWVGYIYYVSANGNVETILDTHTEKRNTADIGYDPVKKVVYVPTFFAKTVAAYRLK